MKCIKEGRCNDSAVRFLPCLLGQHDSNVDLSLQQPNRCCFIYEFGTASPESLLSVCEIWQAANQCLKRPLFSLVLQVFCRKYECFRWIKAVREKLRYYSNSEWNFRPVARWAVYGERWSAQSRSWPRNLIIIMYVFIHKDGAEYDCQVHTWRAFSALLMSVQGSSEWWSFF